MIWPKRKSSLLLLAFCSITLVTLGYLYSHYGSSVFSPGHVFRPSTGLSHLKLSNGSETELEKLHLLLPATSPDVNLCKLILSAAVLGYPTPRLINWNETFDNTGGKLGGGSHVAKITGVLDYLESLDSSKDNDLVFMVDAYDIWFQLRAEVLISRYHAINAAANERLRKRLGTAYDVEDIRQTVIFGAGKRCAPNQVHTIACYPIPASPLPDDLYGENTDTIMGRNKYTSLKQRYLNSGYIIGPVADVRRIFQRAKAKVDALEDHIEWDNGSHGSDFMYHGSDQSIFNTILGEQEFQREGMRRRHHTAEDEKNSVGGKPDPTWIEGTLIDDPLDPSFTHEPAKVKEGKEDEFGIGLDYFSQLGQQTVNSEEDARWLRFDQPIGEQVSKDSGHFDCPSRVTGKLPEDIKGSPPPLSDGTGWDQVPLYTNKCLNTIPIMIHHNGNKDARHFAWPELWLQPHARALMREVLAGSDSVRSSGATLVSDTKLEWSDVCSGDMEGELYRDV